MDNSAPKIWEVKSSRYLSREPWFTARVDSVVLPNGATIPDYYVLEYPNWVNVIAVTRDRRLVMIRQYRHGLGRVSYETPAGVCEKSDASPLDSAQRELMEETGFGGGEWQLWTTLSANPGTHTNLTYTFLATGVERLAEQALEKTEDLTIHLLPPQEVFQLLQKGEIVQSLMAAPLWKYFFTKQKERSRYEVR